MVKKLILDELEKDDRPVSIIDIIVDASGSMAPLREDTVGSINTFIEEQKGLNTEDQVLLSLTTFSGVGWNSAGDNDIKTVFNSLKLDNVPKLTNKQYSPYGSTPLLDAVGERIEQLSKELDTFKTPPSVLVVIITDGEENSSNKYTNEQIKELIETQQSVNSWTFVFMGANQDAWQVGTKYNIAGGNTLNMVASSGGIASAMSKLSSRTANYRSSRVSSYTADPVRSGKYSTNSFWDDKNNTDDSEE